MLVNEEGIETSLSEEQPANADALIDSTDEGISSVVHWIKADSPIDFNDDEKVIFFNDEHSLNANFWISFTELGISITTIEEHLLKTDSPMETIDEGIEIFERDEHSLKAQIPIELTEEGIKICVRDEHSLKQDSPISVRLVLMICIL